MALAVPGASHRYQTTPWSEPPARSGLYGEKVIDLHSHSTVSDGSVAPEGIPALAKAAGCSAVALTDHDSLEGITVATRAAASESIDFVPGCEVSCDWKPGTLHVLVYFVEPGGSPLEDELGRLQQDRLTRNDRLLARLQELGIPISEGEVEARAGGLPGRPHFAAVLVEKGFASSIQDAFDRYLAKGRPAYVTKARLEASRVVALARASGGVAVLAHPLSMGILGSELEAAVRELAEAGLVGLEAVYSRYSPDQREMLASMAHRYGLVATGGSDYHGSFKPGVNIGTGTGDLCVGDEVIPALRQHLG